MIVLVGCVAETDAPPPVIITTVDVQGNELEPSTDVCRLAALLPPEDICSKLCDPDAMALQMAADGSESGTCYQLYCSLPENEHVLVGVCLGP